MICNMDKLTRNATVEEVWTLPQDGPKPAENMADDNCNIIEKPPLKRTDSTCEPASLSAYGLTHSEEYLDDEPHLDLNQYLMTVLEYEDPSYGYEFVSDITTDSHLDNSEDLLNQLQDMGISVKSDYLTLDLDFCGSGPSSLTDNVNDSTSEGTIEADTDPSLTAGRFLRELHRSDALDLYSGPASLGRSLSVEDEVAEAYLTPDGDYKVVYDNLSKDYRSRVSAHQEHVRYLQFSTLGESVNALTNPSIDNRVDVRLDGVKSERSSRVNIRLKPRPVLLVGGKPVSSDNLRGDLKEYFARFPPRLRGLPDKCKFRIKRLLATEMGVEATPTSTVTTPDSGVHENMAALNTEDQEKQNAEWESELAKTEDEIATLRQVLASKVGHANELKRRLGITVWKELSDDINLGLKNVRESQPVVKANEVFSEFSTAVAAAPIFQYLYGRLPALPASASYTADLAVAGRYQKTAGALGSVGEKTGAIFGGIGAKFGALKENPTYKSFEERVGGVYNAAKSKIPGGAAGDQNLEEAFKEAEGEKAAMEAAAAAQEGGVVATDPNAAQMQQPLS